MPDLDFDALSIPTSIRNALKSLSVRHQITRFDPKGGAGYTFFGQNRVLSTDVAIKFYYWGGDPKFHAEPQALTKIQSPNVLSVHDAGYADGDYAYFVTPYCSGGDLDDLLALSALGSVKAVDVISQVLAGLGHLHQARFVHRDIKPLNIFLEEGPTAVIGDFGSLKRIPDGNNAIPASSFSTLYRPPEAVATGAYGFQGDLYQTGVVFYQLLGGYFPYDEVAWLGKREKAAYSANATEADRAIYAKECIGRKILSGRALDYTSIPFWMPKSLRDVVKRACHPDPAKRVQSAADFLAELHKAKSTMPDWALINGVPTMTDVTSYRLLPHNGEWIIEKKGRATWRKDNSFGSMTKEKIVDEINRRRAKKS